LLNQKETMMRMMKLNLFVSRLLPIVGIFFLASCNYSPKAWFNEEVPTRGNIRIGVDESFTLLSEAHLYVFQSIYVDAHITPLYKPELDVLNDFLHDSTRLMVTSRKLTADEEEYFKSRQIFPKTNVIAYDGVAFIVNRKNKDSLIRYNAIKDIFTGKIDKWSKINPNNSIGTIKVVFDNIKSSNVRYIKEKFNIEGNFPKNCYTVNKNEEVLNFVEKNVNALGVISVNWISDKHDSTTKGFLKRVRVVAISSEDNSDAPDFFKPYPGFIADKSYPFIREIYMINRESLTGLASGYLQWATSDQGQRIVLKMGMVPATMPIRLVKTRKNF
jgi:phosphate transport system substrate-binding protein